VTVVAHTIQAMADASTPSSILSKHLNATAVCDGA
jgi:hypothetical protein